jgi:hypothetical protein
VELFLHFFDLMGKILLDLVDKSCNFGHISGVINSTFLAIIPKASHPHSFLEYRPISLCNITYKLISKVIAGRIKDSLFEHITHEQFGFLTNRLIHDAIATTLECIHSIHTKKLEVMVMKLDLQKAYDCVYWSFLCLILTKVGLAVHNMDWIMACVTTVSFAVLINGFPSTFFRVGRGLRQGCSLLPLLFIIFMDDLNLNIREARTMYIFRGLSLENNVTITHLFFVDDVLTFGLVSQTQWAALHSILMRFGEALGLLSNGRNLILLFSKGDREEIEYITRIFGVDIKMMEDGLTYLCDRLKPNKYMGLVLALG